MLSTNTNFDTKHDLAYKTPLYLIHFDGETTDYCNRKPTSPTNSLKQYLTKISGLSQKIVPEEGRSSIGGIEIGLLDKDDEITALLATDSYYFHRKKTTISAGYAGMAESDLITLMTGWVTGIKLSSDGLIYEFEVTDPQKWMQRKIFRGSEESTVTISGNPLNILLQCLTSTGNGTNGDYDNYPAENGLGIDDDFINVANIESIRDDWFPGASHYMYFTIKKRIKAKDFFENEIFKTLNLYPTIDGDGKFNIKVFKPPFYDPDVQNFNEDNIVGLPGWDANLAGVINELEFSYDWDATDEEFDSIEFYIDTDSVNNRGPGKKPVEIKSKGFRSTDPGTSDAITRRKSTIFRRYATPPIKLTAKTFFSRYLSEAGDIVPISHSKLPDIENGVRGLSSHFMEIINRSVDWQRGQVRFELLDTAFEQESFALIAPVMIVTSGTSETVFDVSAADAAKFQEGWVVDVFDDKMHEKATNLTISDITGTQITLSSGIGQTPAAGWIVQFTTYANAHADQKNFWFISSTYLLLESGFDMLLESGTEDKIKLEDASAFEYLITP